MKLRLLLVILSLAFGHSASAQWQQTSGPHGGTVSSIAKTTDGFLAVIGQNLYRYKNNIWTREHEQWRGQLIQSENIILSAHVESAKVSTNEGKTWQDTKLPSDHVEVQFNHFLSVSNDSIFVSMNGHDWTFRSLTPPEPHGFVVNHGRLYCFSGFNGLMYSDNGGLNWEMLQNQPPFQTVLKWVSAGMALYALPYPSGVYQTTDNGMSWEAINYNLYEGSFFEGIAESGDNLFLSDWLTTYRLENKQWVEVPIAKIKTSRIVNGTLYMGTDAGLVSFRDNKITSLNQGVIASEITKLGAAGNSLFAKSLSGVYRTQDGGQNWELNWNSYAEDIVSAKGSVLIRGTSILRSTDEGDTWINIDSAFEEFIVAPTRLIALDNYLYLTSGLVSSGEHGSGAGWTTGGVYRSIDGGDSWHNVSENLPHNGVTHVPVFNIVGANSTVIIQTADGLFSQTEGSRWRRLTPNVDDENALLYSTGERFMMLIDSNWYSSLDGDFWEPIVATAPNDFMRNYEFVYDFTSVRGVPYITTSRYEQIDSISYRSLFRNFKLVGSQWIEITNELPQNTITTNIIEHKGELYAATSSRGVWKSALPQSSVNHVPATKSLVVYPNPASSYVQVTGNVISITNTLGQDFTAMTYDLDRRGISQGEHQISVDQLPPGVYHIRTSNGSGSFIKH